MARAEVEFITYRTADVEHAGDVLVRTFVDYAEIAGMRAWYPYRTGLLERIRNQTPQPYRLRAPGIDVYFSGFPPQTPRREEDKLIYEASDLGFAFLENSQIVLPSQRTHIKRVTTAIAGEMAEVFHLDLTRDPIVLTFPKELYAKEVVVFNAALL